MRIREAPVGAGAAGHSAKSWLCRHDFDRERMLDMEDRVRPVRRRTFLILTITLAASEPWLGWWPALFILPAAGFFALADLLMPRMRRPELLMFGAWIGSEVTIAGAVALEGTRGLGTLCWMAIPVITLSSRFSMRGVVAGVAVALVLTLAVGFGIDASAALHNPPDVMAPLALIMSVAVLSMPLMKSDIQHRSDAVIDQLTGMLNRKALSARALELAQQSEVSGEPVGMIVADLDHFKSINDTHGHEVGDAVLTKVAYTLRKQLRAFDLAYRLGGEEFLVLVPGSDLQDTLRLAERLRDAVADEQYERGLALTMSFGVGASERGGRFNYSAVFARADAALYRAKEAGRNRVCCDEEAAATAVAALA